MENFLAKTHAGKLPDSIVADLLGREMKEWGEGREGDPGHCAQRGEEYGLGRLDEGRRKAIRAVALEAIMQLHKTPVKSRPVGKAYASQMKRWEVLAGAILTRILGDGEEVERESGRKEIILNDSQVFEGQLEQLNNKWDNTDEKYYKREDEIDVHTWNVAAMYPNLKISYIVKEIDERIVERITRLIVERITRLKGDERERAEMRREIVMALMIFMLEYQFEIVMALMIFMLDHQFVKV
jgi:hypothetical protein